MSWPENTLVAGAEPDHPHHIVAGHHLGADIQSEDDPALLRANNHSASCQWIFNCDKPLAFHNRLAQGHVRRQKAFHWRAQRQIIPARQDKLGLGQKHFSRQHPLVDQEILQADDALFNQTGPENWFAAYLYVKEGQAVPPISLQSEQPFVAGWKCGPHNDFGPKGGREGENAVIQHACMWQKHTPGPRIVEVNTPVGCGNQFRQDEVRNLLA